jgi:NADPH-dependent 7-cyano-7-deazaguanine reductase QueF
MKRLQTQPNHNRAIPALEWHILPFSGLCPFSGNPQAGSQLAILYQPRRTFLEVYALDAYVQDFKGGRGEVRDMEGMLAQVAQDCANVLDTLVTVGGMIRLHDGNTMMVIRQAVPCYRFLEYSAQAGKA